MKKSIGLMFLAAALPLFLCTAAEVSADLVIYGGSPAAVTAAIRAKTLGLDPVIVSPDRHIGGLMVSGLGYTDSGNTAAIGGLAREFYHRIYKAYQKPEAWKWEKREDFAGGLQHGTTAMKHDAQEMWTFEPHVAQNVVDAWLAEHNIRIVRGARLERGADGRSKAGVEKKDGRIVSIRTESGDVYRARCFIDATYEGDLMAAAGVTYTVGREDVARYGEEWNGNQPGMRAHGHYFKANISPYRIPVDPASGLCWGIDSTMQTGVRGAGDRRVQAYCYRLCMTDVPENRLPFVKPEGYDPDRYELVRRIYASGWDETFNKFDRIANGKTDTNNHGPFSFDFIGANYDWPEGSYARREKIAQEHYNYQMGLLYFLSTDPGVPESVRARMAKWGLAKDEFTDNGGWPYHIYVREGRRMVGEYVTTERDCLGRRAHPGQGRAYGAIGMGSYTIDSHNTRRYVTEEGFVQNEGDIGVYPRNPYVIDYGSILPRRAECRNLLVPVALSASHSAFGSIRMEPVFMVLGESAATAAALALGKGCAMQDVPYDELKAKLLAQKQVLSTVRIFPPRTLRGFGRVSAEAENYRLTIHAESPEKAALWQAVYASDLTNTIGKVKTDALDGFTVYKLPGEGYTVAVRDGSTVTVVSAWRKQDLRDAIDYYALKPTAMNTVSHAKIPMYLNAYEQYAFRFYYRPEEYPAGVAKTAYDPTGEFDFAKAANDTGFIFWTMAHKAGFASGLANETYWNWAYRLAQERRLPIVLNTSFGDAPHLADAFRAETMPGAPEYTGTNMSTGEPTEGTTGVPSWAGLGAQKATLALLQGVVKKYGKADEVIDILEPHGELTHGANARLLQEYGPLADASFREFLKERHGSLAAVAERYGAPYASWDAVRLPELAEFFGWNARARNLSGAWRLGYPALADGAKKGAVNARVIKDGAVAAEKEPEAWYACGFDDSSWPLIRRMPGSDEAMFLEKRPAVVRRRFTLEDVPEGRMWLYLWDLNQAKGDTVRVVLNGKEVGRDRVRRNVPHHAAYEVTGALKKGDNLLAIRLPKGQICYRVYLSSVEPKAYPYLGAAMNARWVDFSDWHEWIRDRMVQLGISAIREVDPDRGIISMAPGRYANRLRETARRFGARFHNTGYMGVTHKEFLPMLMRGADLPFTLEPGGPARDPMQFKRQMGYYLTEGVNAIHYFIHIGSVFWNPEMRAYFEKIQPALKALGRQHRPKAEIAELFDSDADNRTGFPWGTDPNTAYPSGTWAWPFDVTVGSRFPIDGVVVGDLENGLAAKYKVLLDANNTVMSEETIAGIERYVRAGGVFVAMFQSARHAPETPDAWGLGRISGFTGESITRYAWEEAGDGAEPKETWTACLTATDDVFTPAGVKRRHKLDGTRLRQTADDANVLMRWEDGSPAIGVRTLGAGKIYTFGVRLSTGGQKTFLLPLLDALRMRPRNLVQGKGEIARHGVSDNGLYDVWTLWNHSAKEKPYAFTFLNGAPKGLADLLTGRPAEMKGTLPGWEFRELISPVPGAFRTAAGTWFNVKYGRWQGAEKPPYTVADAPLSYTKEALVLHDGWQVKELGEKDDAACAFADADGWRAAPEGPLVRGKDVSSLRLLLKRTVTVPAAWADGEIHLSCLGNNLRHPTVHGRMFVYANGKKLTTEADGVESVANLPLDVTGGETFTLAYEIVNEDVLLRGVRGTSFLRYFPKPERVIPLAGTWEARTRVTDPKSVPCTLPGTFAGTVVTRHVALDALPKGRRLFIRFAGDRAVDGVIVNGHYLRQYHHLGGELTVMDVTPWMRAGDNEISLIVNTQEENPSFTIRDCNLLLRR